MRSALMVLVVLMAVTGCSAAYTSGPTLSDADRCARWGGRWYDNTCHAGGG